jgi:hypothetical protein
MGADKKAAFQAIQKMLQTGVHRLIPVCIYMDRNVLRDNSRCHAAEPHHLSALKKQLNGSELHQFTKQGIANGRSMLRTECRKHDDHRRSIYE